MHILFYALCLSLFEGGFQTLIAIVSGKMLEAVTNYDKELFIRLLFFALLFSLIIAVVIFAKDTFFSKYIEEIVYKIKVMSIDTICNASIPWVDNIHKGELFSRVTSDVNMLANSIRPVVIMGISRIISKVILVSYMFYVNWFLTLVVFSILPITSTLQAITKKTIKKHNNNKMESMGKIVSVFSDCLDSQETVKTLSLENKMSEKFKQYQDDYLKSSFRLSFVNALLSPLEILSKVLPHCVVLLVGGYLVVNNKLSIGQLLTFTMLASSAINVLGDVFTLIAKIQTLKVCIERIVDLWNIPQEIINTSGVSYICNDDASIMFKNICYSYNSDKSKNVLDNINFTVKSGEFVALTGESGCGKSTILKLIAGFYEADKGDIFVSGEIIKNWNITGLRKNVAYVTQDTFLFDATILENITCFDKETSLQEIMKIINSVGLGDFIKSLKDGLHTNIGEVGSFLSGGQKQRISIARALYKKPSILLLDESTSGLDLETESEIIDTLINLENRPTIILITHRLKAIENLDKIINIQNGCVSSMGGKND